MKKDVLDFSSNPVLEDDIIDVIQKKLMILIECR